MAVAHRSEAVGADAVARVVWPKEDNRIPQDVLTDPELFEIEMLRVYGGPVWHLVAHEAELRAPGDFKTCEIGGVPVVVTRDEHGGVHALVNACAHRGSRVVMDPWGNLAGRGLRCIYHAWRYDLDGRLTAVTMPEDFPADFDKADYGLPRLRSEILAGCVFVTLSDAAPPLADYLGELAAPIRDSMADGALVLLGCQKVIFRNNWKVYAENIYDGYHTVSLHKAFRLLRMRAAGGMCQSPDFERYGHGWQEYSTLPPDEVGLLEDPSVLELRSKPESVNRIINVFPCSIISDQMDTLTIRYVLPRSVAETEVHFVSFAREGEADELVEHRVRQASNLFGPEGFITLEDGSALARVQMGAAARRENIVLKGAAKRFPPYRVIDEAAIRHFYAHYQRIMGFPIASG